MRSFEDEVHLPPATRAVLLERVVRRGHQISRRRLAGRGLFVAAVVGLLAAGVARVELPTGGTTIASDDTPVPTAGSPLRGGRLVTGGGPAPDEPGPAPTTSTETTAVPTTTAPPAPTTTAAAPLACRNSADPRCGPFRWDPAPEANQPLLLTISMSPSEPVAGQPVRFRVVANDPDARIVPADRWHVRFGDEGEAAADSAALAGSWECPAYGPWDPPPAQRGSAEADFTHAYERAGEYVALFVVWSESDTAAPPCAGDPYAGSVRQEIRLTVR